MKRLLLILLLVLFAAALVHANPLRLGYYFGPGKDDTTDASQLAFLQDTIINGGYEHMSTGGEQGVTWLHNNYPWFFSTHYTAASWIQHVGSATAPGGDSVFAKFAAANYGPWNAWMRIRRGDTTYGDMFVTLSDFDSTGLSAVFHDTTTGVDSLRATTCAACTAYAATVTIDSAGFIYRMKVGNLYDTIPIEFTYDTTADAAYTKIILDTVDVSDYDVATQPETTAYFVTGLGDAKLDNLEIGVSQLSRNRPFGYAVLHAMGVKVYHRIITADPLDTLHRTTDLAPSGDRTLTVWKPMYWWYNATYYDRVDEDPIGIIDSFNLSDPRGTGYLHTAMASQYLAYRAPTPRLGRIYDRFGCMADFYLDAEWGRSSEAIKMKTPGVVVKDGSWTDHTEGIWREDAGHTITFTVDDTVYFGDFYPNDSLRLDLSTAASTSDTSKLVVEYYDTSDAWVAAPANLTNAIKTAFTTITDTTVWFDPGIDLGKWKYYVVPHGIVYQVGAVADEDGRGPYHLLWCRMYWDASLSGSDPVITQMGRAGWGQYNRWLTTHTQYAWNPNLDTDGDGWRDSTSAHDSLVQSIANCDAYSHVSTVSARERMFCAGERNSVPTDSSLVYELFGLWAKEYISDAPYKGITFDQAPVAQFDGDNVATTKYRYYGENFGSDSDSLTANRRNDMLQYFHKHAHDSVVSYRRVQGDSGFTAATASSYYGLPGPYYDAGRTWWGAQLRGWDFGNPRNRNSTTSDTSTWIDAVDLWFTEHVTDISAGADGQWIGVGDRWYRYPYEFVCTAAKMKSGSKLGPRLLNMWSIGYSPTYPTRYVCDTPYIEVWTHYVDAWARCLRPGGTGADTSIDKLFMIGTYSGVAGQYVACRGAGDDVSDAYAHVWRPIYTVDIGEPVKVLDTSQSYATLIADSLWETFPGAATNNFWQRKYIQNTDTNLALFRWEGETYILELYDSSSTQTLDTFALPWNCYRVYENGDTASPLNRHVSTPNDSVALFENDGATLIHEENVDFACRIGTDQPSLSFTDTVGTGDPADQLLEVLNLGDSAQIKWTAAKGETWLSITPTFGFDSAGTGPDTITVSVDLSGLSADTYYDTITVTDTSGCADNTPLDIPVQLNLIAAPVGADTAHQIKGVGVIRGVGKISLKTELEIDDGTESDSESGRPGVGLYRVDAGIRRTDDWVAR